jgi:hypothetical protein
VGDNRIWHREEEEEGEKEMEVKSIMDGSKKMEHQQLFFSLSLDVQMRMVRKTKDDLLEGYYCQLDACVYNRWQVCILLIQTQI